MLIESYQLEQAVITAGIPDQMLHGLDKLGVTGLGFLADGLRKPVAVKRPLAESDRLARSHFRHPEVAGSGRGDSGTRRNADGGLPALAQ